MISKIYFILLLFLIGCVVKEEPVTENTYYAKDYYDIEENNPSIYVEEKSRPLETSLIQEEIQSDQIATPEEIKSEAIPRKILVLWDSAIQRDISFTIAHKFAEMPLNFLGLHLEYVDLQKPLPDLKERKDVYGVLSWLPDTYKLFNPNRVIQWLLSALDLKKKCLIINSNSLLKEDVNYGYINELWQRLGIFPIGTWSTITYEYNISFIDERLYPFEGIFERPYPGFQNFVISDPEAKSHLNLQSQINPEKEFALIVTNHNGGFAHEEFLIYNFDASETVYRKWYVNPFKFFKLVFQIPDFPIPDPSTLAGRRIYFSHIDGDGWNNETQVIDTKGTEKILSSDIILKQVAEKTPDLPLTVGPIAANLNPEWNGTALSQNIARKFFDLNQIEVGCHTYSHPFDWGFFKDYSEAKETPFLDRYQTTTWKNSLLGSFRRLFQKNESFYRLEDDELLPVKEKKPDQPHYYTPRAYARKLFDLDLEVFGAIEEVNQFTPPSKKVKVYQWSGNALPWKQVLIDVDEARVQNINGGDPRFDYLFPSYAYLCPLTRNLGSEKQVYSCSSNENLYTSLWTKNFFGFVNLPITFAWSETPLRIKGMNLYYHMYSGEKKPSLYALLQNISYIRLQKLTPIPTSEYCEMVNGFYSAEIVPGKERSWLIKNHGRLLTFRVDNGTFTSVDFGQSEGVIGQRHHQGSLYIYLDAANRKPQITLTDIQESYPEPILEVPYLLDSRWKVWDLRILSNDHFLYTTEGFGIGDCTWIIPKNGIYHVKLLENGEEVAAYQVRVDSHHLTINFSEALSAKQIEVRLLNES